MIGSWGPLQANDSRVDRCAFRARDSSAIWCRSTPGSHSFYVTANADIRARFVRYSMSQSVAVVRSRALASARAVEVTVEVHLANGLPCFAIVGLAATKVRESRDRVRAAIQNSMCEFPIRRIKCRQPPFSRKLSTVACMRIRRD